MSLTECESDRKCVLFLFIYLLDYKNRSLHILHKAGCTFVCNANV